MAIYYCYSKIYRACDFGHIGDYYDNITTRVREASEKELSKEYGTIFRLDMTTVTYILRVADS